MATQYAASTADCETTMRPRWPFAKAVNAAQAPDPRHLAWRYQTVGVRHSRCPSWRIPEFFHVAAMEFFLKKTQKRQKKGTKNWDFPARIRVTWSFPGLTFPLDIFGGSIPWDEWTSAGETFETWKFWEGNLSMIELLDLTVALSSFKQLLLYSSLVFCCRKLLIKLFTTVSSMYSRVKRS